MIIITDPEGRRLCRDGLVRGFAPWGTYPICVKTYKSKAWAFRRAREIGGYALEIPEDVTMDATGRAYRNIPSGTGYHRVKDVPLDTLKLRQ